MSLPSRKSEDQSRTRGQEKARGASHDEPQERPWPVRTFRKPHAGELDELLRDVPERLARRIKES